MPEKEPQHVLGALSLGTVHPRVDPAHAVAMIGDRSAEAAELVNRHKVRQLALDRLSGLPGRAAQLRARIAEDAERAATRSAAAWKLAEELPGIADAAGVEAAGMKGLAARLWYPADDRRDVSDADVWVPDVAQAWALYRELSGRFGHTLTEAELPWFKRAPDGGYYGVVMLAPARPRDIHIDIHFGRYSVGHCASFPVRPELSGSGLPMLAVEDNLCCAVANAAGDCFIDVKTLNDLHLALRRKDVAWERVRATLDGVGLLGFLGSLAARLVQLAELGEPATENLRRLGALPRDRMPRLTGVTSAERCRATVRHALRIGRRASLAQATRLGTTAYRYYRGPLRLGAAPALPGRVFRVRANAWTCTRLVPPALAEQALGGALPAGPAAAAKPGIPLAPGLELLPTDAGDLVRLGSNVFVPTVYYRLRTPHVLAAKRAAAAADRPES